MKIRYGRDRGTADFGWLDSRHTFSFGGYYDPDHMGFSSLRVINEDRVKPGRGFGTHPHRDMEIISYVLSGALEHRDSIGNGSIIRPGDVQRMSAGTGIFHSEFNASKSDPVHFLQIWIVPDRRGLRPSYEQTTFSEAEKWGKLQLVGSPDGRDNSVQIHQDVQLYVSSLKDGQTVSYSLPPGRVAWVQVARGSLRSGDRELTAGDGIAVNETDVLTLAGTSDTAEVLLFDLAARTDL